MNFIFIAETKCNFGELKKNSTSGNTSGTVTLFCSFGTMQTVSEFGLSLASGASSCPTDQYGVLSVMDSCSIDSMGQNYRSVIENEFNLKCLNKVSCTMNIDRIMFNNNCSSEIDSRVSSSGLASVYM
jgi:hypothetical protein